MKQERVAVPKDRKDELETPPWFYEWLNSSFNFTHDVACTRINAKARYLGPDTLNLPWGPRNYLNPPYSNPEPFLEKAYKETLYDRLTVALVKHDHSTMWWKTWVEHHTLKIPVPWRLRHYLDGKPTTEVGNFPSTVLIYLPKLERGE